MSGKGESVLVRLTPPSRPASRQHAPSSPPQRDSAAARGCSVYALEASQRHAQVRSCRPRKAEKSSADVSMGGAAALAIGLLLLLASDAGRSGAEAAANSSQHGARRPNRIVLTQPRAVQQYVWRLQLLRPRAHAALQLAPLDRAACWLTGPPGAARTEADTHVRVGIPTRYE